MAPRSICRLCNIAKMTLIAVVYLIGAGLKWWAPDGIVLAVIVYLLMKTDCEEDSEY